MSIMQNLLIKPLRAAVEHCLTAGAARAVRTVWLELKAQSRHRAALKRVKPLCSGTNLKLNIGCGDNLKEGWINIDLHRPGTYQLDVREPLPFQDGTVSTIYSEHFFEHLEYPSEITLFLSESLRCLKPGGVFSVGVPDAEWGVVSYTNNDKKFFENAKLFHPKWCNTRMHVLNYLFRQMGEHQYAYDYETLDKILTEAGFVSIQQRSFDPALDSELRRIGTLYVEAKKGS